MNETFKFNLCRRSIHWPVVYAFIGDEGPYTRTGLAFSDDYTESGEIYGEIEEGRCSRDG